MLIEWILNSVRTSMHEYTSEELGMWAEHVKQNPYSVEGASERVIEILKEEILKREMKE